MEPGHTEKSFTLTSYCLYTPLTDLALFITPTLHIFKQENEECNSGVEEKIFLPLSNNSIFCDIMIRSFSAIYFSLWNYKRFRLIPEKSIEQREETCCESTALFLTGDVLEEMFQENKLLWSDAVLLESLNVSWCVLGRVHHTWMHVKMAWCPSAAALDKC